MMSVLQNICSLTCSIPTALHLQDQMDNSSETQSHYNEENDQSLNTTVASRYLFIYLFLEALIHVLGNDFHDLGSSPFDPNSYLR